MKIYILLATFLLVNTNCFAGFPPQTVIRPNIIMEGAEVFIGYDPLQFPCLQSITNFEGDSEYIDIDSNNHIEVTISALGFSPCLNIGVDNPPYTFHGLGGLPVGEYTIQMYWVHPGTPFPVPDNATRGIYGQNISFVVLAPVVIPLLNFYSLIALGGILMFASFLYLLKKSKTTLINHNLLYLDKYS